MTITDEQVKQIIAQLDLIIDLIPELNPLNDEKNDKIIAQLDSIVALLSDNNSQNKNTQEKQELENKHVLIQFDLIKSQIACLESQNEKILDKLEDLKK